MIPSRLVPLQMYEYEELASEDQRLLAEASIPAFVKRRGRAYPGVSLMVAEGDVERATAVLSGSASVFRLADNRPFAKCPYCGSIDVESRPYYATIPLGFGFVFGAVMTVRGSQLLGLAGFGISAAVATLVYARFARAQCRSCGRGGR
jgi:hypothetical protein